jgi:hypothetical protein
MYKPGHLQLIREEDYFVLALYVLFTYLACALMAEWGL